MKIHSHDFYQDSVTLPPSSITSLSDIPPLSDFLVDPISLKVDIGVCIRRSDGRLYTIKKRSQTRQAWSELNILLKIRKAHVPFAPLLHWTYERDQYIYLISVSSLVLPVGSFILFYLKENYPTGSLADAIGHYGAFSSSDVFFYACELVGTQFIMKLMLALHNAPQLIGLRFLHDIGVVHRNVSPETVIFDRRGHLILSGVENGIDLRSRTEHFLDFTKRGDKRYQAPEIMLGWSHNDLVDSWSFGMVIFFMFRGKVRVFGPCRNITDSGQHVFFEEAQDFTEWFSKDINEIIIEGLHASTPRPINPIAKDLILRVIMFRGSTLSNTNHIFQCLKRNPAMRKTIRDIQQHPYFSNA